MNLFQQRISSSVSSEDFTCLIWGWKTANMDYILSLSIYIYIYMHDKKKKNLILRKIKEPQKVCSCKLTHPNLNIC